MTSTAPVEQLKSCIQMWEVRLSPGPSIRKCEVIRLELTAVDISELKS